MYCMTQITMVQPGVEKQQKEKKELANWVSVEPHEMETAQEKGEWGGETVWQFVVIAFSAG
jgi:hypothetical protein